MKYETTYVIVAGVAWIRRSRVETVAGDVEDAVWAVTFDGTAPTVRRARWSDGVSVRSGRIDDLDWELHWRQLAPSFETPVGLLRRLAPTRLVTSPALAISGRLGDRELQDAPGHTARLEGRRHAQTWGWAHASAADGRWAHLLTATAPPLPRLAQHGRDGAPPRLPLARGVVDGSQVRVGKYTVDAPEATFVGLRYLDTDGSSLWCYHSERAWLRGDGVDFQGAALEIAVREPIEGWTVEP